MQMLPPVPPWFCYNCGIETQYGANFCQHCGARLKPASSSAWIRFAQGCLLLLLALAAASSGSVFLLLATMDAMNWFGSGVVVFGLTGFMLIVASGGCIYWLIKSQQK